jgi:hypothetical protein
MDLAQHATATPPPTRDPSPTTPAAFSDADAVALGIGHLVCSWGELEQSLMAKLAAMRVAAGDVRIVGARSKPGVSRLLAELRALISMRDRHDKTALADISEIERLIQRIGQLRLLVVEGFEKPEHDAFVCRDTKNVEHRIGLAHLAQEIAEIDAIRERLARL